jgi:hypothetical protein
MDKPAQAGRSWHLMTHEGLISSLTEYADGNLAPRRRETLERHLAECEECSTWLEAYRVLALELRCSCQAPSMELAVAAVDSSRLTDEARKRVLEHTATCSECRDDLSLAHQALSEARGASSLRARLRDTVEGAARWLGRAGIAASILLVVLVSSSVFLWRRHKRVEVSQPAHQYEVLESQTQLFLDNLQIGEGTELVARASESVVLGEGFVVRSGGRLTVEVKNSRSPKVN